MIYGFEGYKVHSKICLITYRHRNEIQYITQIGTGNYNEKTAAMYTDVSLMTADRRIGEDAAEFFKNMSISNLDGRYEELIVAPTSLKQKILLLIDEEIEKGPNGRIVMKMNSVTDMDFIEKIAEASRAGVRVDLIVRGICCILPGIEGETENLRVISIVGRYLEHSRIYCFGDGDDMRVYIASGDFLTRNTERRVEVGLKVPDRALANKLRQILELQLSDNVNAREMKPDGSYSKVKAEPGAPRVDSQMALYDLFRDSFVLPVAPTVQAPALDRKSVV